MKLTTIPWKFSVPIHTSGWRGAEKVKCPAKNKRCWIQRGLETWHFWFIVKQANLLLLSLVLEGGVEMEKEAST